MHTHFGAIISIVGFGFASKRRQSPITEDSWESEELKSAAFLLGRMVVTIVASVSRKNADERESAENCRSDKNEKRFAFGNRSRLDESE